MSKINRNTGGRPSGSELRIMSIFSFLFYIILAYAIFYFFHDQDITDAFKHGVSVSNQLVTGLIAGFTASALIIFFSSRPPMKQVLNDFSIYKIISNLELSLFDRIHISLFAGFGEELLFRGAIQPLLGIWLTSFIFIAIHGYVSIRSAGHILFTLSLFGLSMMLGFLYETAGLLSAIIAHAIYDIIMLGWVNRKK